MGNTDTVAVCSLGIAVSFITTVFGGWVLYKVVESAQNVLAKRPKRSFTTVPNDVLCPFVFGRFSTVQFTMGITVLTVALMLLCLAMLLLFFVAMLLTFDDEAKSDEPPSILMWISLVWFLFYVTQFVLMLVTHFERLRLTFRMTSHRVPKWAPKILYALLTLNVIVSVVFAAVKFKGPLAVLCTVYCFLAFLGISATLIRAFFRRTIQVAKGRLSVAGIDPLLVNAALRVSISVTASLLSTAFSGTFIAVSLAVAKPFHKWLLLARNSIVCCDLSLNVFCLLCTFRDANAYYQFVFGRVHAKYLSHFLPNEPETEIVQSVTAQID